MDTAPGLDYTSAHHAAPIQGASAQSRDRQKKTGRGDTMPGKYFAFSSDAMNLLLKSAAPDAEDVPPQGLAYVRMPSGAHIPRGDFARKPQNAGWLERAKALRAGDVLGLRNSGRPNLMEWLAAKGYTALPLDGTAFHACVSAGIALLPPFDLLPPAAFDGVSNATVAALKKWSDTPPDTGWSVNWFAHDSLRMRSAFATAFRAAVIVPELGRRAARLLAFLPDKPQSHTLTESNSIAELTWSEALPGRVTFIRYPGDCAPGPSTEIVRPDECYAKLAGAVVFNGVDWYRYRVPLSNVVAARLRPAAILHNKMLYAAAQHYYKARENICGMPFETFPIAYAPGDGAAKEEDEAAGPLAAAAECFPYPHALAPLLRDILPRRLRSLDRAYGRLRDLWKKYPPAVCLGENVPEGERCLGLLAAAELGIPSVGLPHSTLYASGLLAASAPCDVIAHHSEMMAAYERNLPGARIPSLSFSDVSLETSYPFKAAARPFSPNTGLRILVLPSPTLHLRTPLSVGIHPDILCRWVEALQGVPSELRGLLAVSYKVHPAHDHERNILRDMAGLDESCFIASDTALASLLPETDLLLCLEYVSSPTILGMKAGVPVVTCMLAERRVNRQVPSFYRDIAGAGAHVESPSALWRTLSPLLGDSEARAAVCERQQAFLRDVYLVSRNGHLTDWISRFLPGA